MVSTARSKQNPSPRTPRKSPRGAAARARSARQGPRPEALIVEPDPELGEQLSRVLRALGWATQELRDPAKAVATATRRSPHVVFLDVSDEAGEGLRALDTIRAANDHLCVVCTTTDPDVQVAVATMRAQAFDYVQQPLDAERIDTLSQAVLEHCGLSESMEEQLHRAVGARIREHRHAAGFTLQQTAHRTGLSISLISQIELGKSGASLISLHKLAHALGVPMSAFLGDS